MFQTKPNFTQKNEVGHKKSEKSLKKPCMCNHREKLIHATIDLNRAHFKKYKTILDHQ